RRAAAPPAPARPATPPPAPRRATTTHQPAAPPPPPPAEPEPTTRKAVLSSPQKRLSPRSATSDSVRPPPPVPSAASSDPDLTHTARTQPARAALPPPEEHTVRAVLPQSLARAAPPVPPEEPPRAEARPRGRSSVDVPRAPTTPPPPAPPPPAPPERHEQTAMVRMPVAPADARRGAPPAAGPRRRTQAQLPSTNDADVDVTTRPARAFQDARRRPPEDDEDEGAHAATQAGVTAIHGSSGTWMVVLAAVLIALAVGTTAVALGLDRGVISGWVSSLLDGDGKQPAPTPLPPRQQAAPPALTTPTPPAPPPAPGSGGAPEGTVMADTTGTPPPAEAPVAEPPTAQPEDAAEADAPDADESSQIKKSKVTITKRPKEPVRGGKARSQDGAEPQPSATGEPGFLSLSTDPSAKVYVGGRMLGDTPLTKASLPAGKHNLKLVDGSGRSFTLPVDIKTGEVTTVRMPLEMLSH
ncbi:PEGA domain-containing protein, partial [Myxococcus sp. K15C18031901]|uniref:PEGA domain-containing protein n=1 Tax=Myxococcus dinghuensis TaxID=2906761 RepID=UPI0020A7F8FC